MRLKEGNESVVGGDGDGGERADHARGWAKRRVEIRSLAKFLVTGVD